MNEIEQIIRKHFEMNDIEYEDTFFPMKVNGTWGNIVKAIQGIIEESKS